MQRWLYVRRRGLAGRTRAKRENRRRPTLSLSLSVLRAPGCAQLREFESARKKTERKQEETGGLRRSNCHVPDSRTRPEWMALSRWNVRLLRGPRRGRFLTFPSPSTSPLESFCLTRGLDFANTFLLCEAPPLPLSYRCVVSPILRDRLVRATHELFHHPPGDARARERASASAIGEASAKTITLNCRLYTFFIVSISEHRQNAFRRSGATDRTRLVGWLSRGSYRATRGGGGWRPGLLQHERTGPYVWNAEGICRRHVLIRHIPAHSFLTTAFPTFQPLAVPPSFAFRRWAVGIKTYRWQAAESSRLGSAHAMRSRRRVSVFVV